MKKGTGDVACCLSSLEYLNAPGYYIEIWLVSCIATTESDLDCLGPMAYLEAAQSSNIRSSDANGRGPNTSSST